MPMPIVPERFTRTIQARKLVLEDRWEMKSHPLFEQYRVKAPNKGLCQRCKTLGRGELVEVVTEVLRTPFISLNIPSGAHGASEYRFVPRKATRVLSGKRVCDGCGGFGSREMLPPQATNPLKTSDVEIIKPPLTRKERRALLAAKKEPSLFNDDL